MKFDLNRFGVNRPFIKRYHREHPEDDAYSVSLIAATVGCPIIVLAYYLAEEIGFTPGLLKTIQGQLDRGFRALNTPDNDPFKDLYK